VTQQEQPWQSFEGRTESPSSDPLSGLPSSLERVPQEAKPRESASPDAWRDMVRSVAVSTADLWQEVLDRLARLEANQEALVNSLREFRALVIEQQAKPQLGAPPFVPPPPPPLDQGWSLSNESPSMPSDLLSPPVQQESVASPEQPEASEQPEPEQRAAVQAESESHVQLLPEPPAPPERQWSELPPVASLGSEELAGVLAAEFGPYATQSDHGSATHHVDQPLHQAPSAAFQEREPAPSSQQDPVLSALFAEPPASQKASSSTQISTPPPPPPDFSWSQGTEQSPGQASQPGQPVPETTGSFQSPAIPVDYDPNDFALQTEHPAPQVGPEQLPPPEVAQRAPDPPITPDFFARVRKGIMGH